MLGSYLKLDNAGKVFLYYAIAAAGTCLVFPNGINLHSHFGVIAEHLPLQNVIANIDGALPFYKDYFIFLWLTMPLWLCLVGYAYIKHPPPRYFPRRSPLIIFIAATISLVILFMVPTNRHKITHDDYLTRDTRVLVLAAKHRIMGAPVFGGSMTIIFMMMTIVFVMTPIDLVRQSDT